MALKKKLGPGGAAAAGDTYHMKTSSGAATEQTRDNAVTLMAKHNIPAKQAYSAQKTVITGAFDCAVDGDLVNNNQAARRDVAERAEIIQCHQTLQMCSHPITSPWRLAAALPRRRLPGRRHRGLDACSNRRGLRCHRASRALLCV